MRAAACPRPTRRVCCRTAAPCGLEQAACAGAAGYDEASQLQLEAFNHFWPWLADALPSCPAIPPVARAHMITLADYGCSEGGNSAAQFKRIKEALIKGGALESVRALPPGRPGCGARAARSAERGRCAGARRADDAGHPERPADQQLGALRTKLHPGRPRARRARQLRRLARAKVLLQRDGGARAPALALAAIEGGRRGC